MAGSLQPTGRKNTASPLTKCSEKKKDNKEREKKHRAPSLDSRFTGPVSLILVTQQLQGKQGYKADFTFFLVLVCSKNVTKPAKFIIKEKKRFCVSTLYSSIFYLPHPPSPFPFPYNNVYYPA